MLQSVKCLTFLVYKMFIILYYEKKKFSRFNKKKLKYNKYQMKEMICLVLNTKYIEILLNMRGLIFSSNFNTG